MSKKLFKTLSLALALTLSSSIACFADTIHEVESNNTFSAADSIDFGSSNRAIAIGSVSSSDRSDFYKFTINTATNIFMDTETQNGTNCDIDLVLYDGNRNEIASGKSGSDKIERLRAGYLAPGTYYIEVYNYSRDDADYELWVDKY